MTASRRIVDTADGRPRRPRLPPEARSGAIHVLPLIAWLASLALIALATTLITQDFATDTPIQRAVDRLGSRVESQPAPGTDPLPLTPPKQKTDSAPLRSSSDLQIVTGDGLQMTNALNLIPLADAGSTAD